MRSSGIALVATLALMTVIGIIVFGTFFRTQIELWVTRNDTTSVQAFYAAEAGVQKYKAVLFQQVLWREKSTTSGGSSGCYTSIASGLDLDRDGVVEYSSYPVKLDEEVVVDADGNPVGRYKVTIFKHTGTLYTIESAGESSGAKAVVKASIQMSNANYLEQAIFSGTGQVAQWLNGGAQIRGGIFIHGTVANASSYVIQSDGNFSLKNHYSTSEDNFGRGVLNPYLADEYERVNDLCATLRVRYGKIEFSGSAQVGEPNNRVKGVYVGNGQVGRDKDIDAEVYAGTTPCPDKKGICTEALGPFDLSNPPPFPSLSDQLTENFRPKGCEDFSGTWRECLQNKADLLIGWNGSNQTTSNQLPDSCPLKKPSSRDIVLPPTNQGQGGGKKGSGPSLIDCRVGGRGFTYDPNNNVIAIYGNVVLEGFNLTFSQPVRYRVESGESATLAILAKNSGGGKITVEQGFLPDSTKGVFPNHVVGLIAEGDFIHKSPSGNDKLKETIMAPIYAGGTYCNEKDAQIFGSVVANGFSTACQSGAGQKARIVHVRVPKEKQPAFLPTLKGGHPTFRVVSYERR